MKPRVVIIVGAGLELRATIGALMAAEKICNNDKVLIIETKKERKSLEEIYPPAKEKPFVIKCHDPMPECFFDKPKKPRYNPKTGETKYF